VLECHIPIPYWLLEPNSPSKDLDYNSAQIGDPNTPLIFSLDKGKKTRR